MSDKTKTESTLKPETLQAIVTGFATAYAQANSSGSFIAQFCVAAGKAGLPANPADADVIVIADAIAAKLGWDKTKRAKVYKSEARAILRAHATIPEGIAAYTADKRSMGKCGYHDVVSIGRALTKNEGNVKKAISELLTESEPTRTDPKVRAQSAIKSWYTSVRDSSPKSASKKAERAAVMEALEALASKLSLEIGVVKH